MHHEEYELKKALKHFGLADLEASFIKYLRDNKPNIKDKQLRFADDLKLFTAQYDKEMLKSFYNHFAEPNMTHTKLRFEMEKTWHTGMRLKKWSRNNFNKTKTPNNERKPVESFWRQG